MTENAKVDITALRKEIGETMSEIGRKVTKQQEEIARFGKSSEETGGEIKSLNDRLDGHLEEFKGIKESMDDFLAKRNRAGADNEAERKSPGQLLAESDEVKAMLASGTKDSGRVQLGSLTHAMKSLSTGSASSLAGHLGTERVAGVVAKPVRQPRIRDLFASATTTNGSIEYVEETGFYHIAAAIVSAVSSTETAIRTENAYGFFVGQTITLSAGTAQEETAEVTAVALDTGILTVSAGVTNAHAIGKLVTADRFVFTPETQLKPNAAINFALKTTAIKTLAHGLPASRQILGDIDALRAHVDNRLLEGLMLVEEEQLLRGDGSTNQLEGIMTNSRVATYAWNAAGAPTTDTKLDALRRSITLASKANYPPDAMVVSVDDWEDVELTKGSDGHYIWTAVGEGANQRVWRTNVIATTAMLAGEALVGAFGMGGMIYDREEASIRISESHNDQFMRNMVQILAEERIALVNFRPEAFVAVDLSTAPA